MTRLEIAVRLIIAVRGDSSGFTVEEAFDLADAMIGENARRTVAAPRPDTRALDLLREVMRAHAQTDIMNSYGKAGIDDLFAHIRELLAESTPGTTP